MKTLKLVVAASTILFCSVVSSAVITHSDTITGEWSNNVMDFGLTEFNITGFDSSLGTLTEIQFELITTVDGFATFQNTTFNSGTFERSVRGIITMLGMGFALFTDVQTPTEVLAVGPRETVTAFMGPTVGTAQASSISQSFLDTFIDPLNGIRTLAASIAIDPGGTISGDNGANFTGNITQYSNDVSGTLNISYIFNEATGVPEPSIIGLMIIGLLGLGLRRRQTDE